MVPPTWTSTHRDSDRWRFCFESRRKGMRRPNHTEGEIKGDLPHPNCSGLCNRRDLIATDLTKPEGSKARAKTGSAGLTPAESLLLSGFLPPVSCFMPNDRPFGEGGSDVVDIGGGENRPPCSCRTLKKGICSGVPLRTVGITTGGVERVQGISPLVAALRLESRRFGLALGNLTSGLTQRLLSESPVLHIAL